MTTDYTRCRCYPPFRAANNGLCDWSCRPYRLHSIPYSTPDSFSDALYIPPQVPCKGLVVNKPPTVKAMLKQCPKMAMKGTLWCPSCFFISQQRIQARL